MEMKADMRGMQEVRRAPMVVTHMTAKGSGFATRTDTGERVYVPPRVALATGIEIGRSYDANLIDNTHADANSFEHVPYVAVFVYPHGNRADMLEQLLRRVEEGETSSRDANVLRTIFVDMKIIPSD